MMNKLTKFAVLLLITLPFTGSNLMAGDAAAGKKKSAACAACHGADGKGLDPSYPILAGQHEDYLAHSLHAYKSGERKNPIMAGMSAGLSEEDIADLAAYYASMDDGLQDLSDHK